MGVLITLVKINCEKFDREYHFCEDFLILPSTASFHILILYKDIFFGTVKIEVTIKGKFDILSYLKFPNFYT